MPRKKSQRTTSKTSSGPTDDGGKQPLVYGFFERILRHSKGQKAGQPFVLMPWQKKVLSDIFGTLKQDGTRQYRTAYIELGCALGP